MTTYIYGLFCPVAETIRYIGKSDNPEKRLRAHLVSAASFQYRHHTSAWLRQLLNAALKPQLIILEEINASQRWQEAERAWIARADEFGWDLTNSTFGGEGLDFRNLEEKAAYCAKLSATLTEIWNRPERKEEARQRSLKAWADPEVTAKRLASVKRAYEDPELRALIGRKSKESGARPDVKAKRAAAAKANFASGNLLKTIQSEGFKEDQSERLIGRWADPRHRELMAKNRWSISQREEQAKRLADRADKIEAAMTPEVRAKQAIKMKAKHADPEYKARMSAAQKAKWADPEYQKKMVEIRKASWAKRKAALAQAKLCADENSGYDALDIQKDQPPCA